MSKCEKSDEKLLICFNIPAIAKALGTLKFNKMFFPIYERLLNDSDISVRYKAIAAICDVSQ